MACITSAKRTCQKSALSFLFILLSFFAKPQIITTIAGNGTAGFSGDGGLSKNALLNSPLALCLDPQGNIYFTDFGNQRVRRIDAVTGVITTIAGNGTAGFSGDGGPAINAQFNNPFRLCLDNSGNLYVSDYNNLRVRKVNLATGIISTIAGDGTQNYINGGVAVNSGMLPIGLAFDGAGNLYISQHMPPLVTFTSNIISKLNLATGVITTVAGTGMFGFAGDGGPAINAQFFNPDGLSFDALGNLYVDDQNNNRIRKISIVTGIVTTVAGDGGANYNLPDGTTAVNYSFKNLTDVFVDASGNLITSDESNLKIQKINLSTGTITTLAGTGYLGFGKDCVDPTTVTLGDCPSAVTDAAGNLYFTDLVYHRIRKVIKSSLMQPQIRITSNVDTVCAGSTVTFHASVTNTSANPTFQWKINGFNAGSNSNNFSGSSFANGDVVTCSMKLAPLFICDTPVNTSSNGIKITVKDKATLSVSISTLTDTLCSGAFATIIATALNGGLNPNYQWKINGMNSGTSNKYYISNTFSNADVVSCTITVDTSLICVLNNTATSGDKMVTVLNEDPPSIKIISSGNNICAGDTITFKAQSQYAGNSPKYNWILNNIKLDDHSGTFSSYALSDGDQLYCEVVPDVGACSMSPVSSDLFAMIVNNLPTVNLSPADTSVTVGAIVQLKAVVSPDVISYQWSPSDKLANSLSLASSTTPVSDNTIYTLSVESDKGCKAIARAIVKIFTSLYMPDAFTPNGDGVNDVFRIPSNASISLKEFSIYDRWGARIFTTKNKSKGWDGTFNGKALNAGAFVYYIRGTSDKGEVFVKGNVVLIR